MKDFMTGFNELTELTTKFVEAHKGQWDHYAWLDFLSDLQKKGFEVNDEMQKQMGIVAESMKKCYSAISNSKGMANVMGDISTSTIEFMKKTKGVWDQSGWESYLNGLQKKGISLNKETQSYVGGVLEAAKELYTFMPNAVKSNSKSA